METAHLAVYDMKRMHMFYLILLICLILALIFLYIRSNKQLKKVYVRGVCVRVKLATTNKARRIGLMLHKSMPQNQGMLFIFEKEGIHSFWMKNMHFPLDIIWFNSDKIIVDIYEYAIPCKDVCKNIVPQVKALFVLEVNAGFVKKHGIKVGDSLNF